VLQESAVQLLRSSQFGGAPPTQLFADPLHASLVVQALPSVHAAPAGCS
jgi:hypothetical protein